jgi:hypothetical protein
MESALSERAVFTCVSLFGLWLLHNVCFKDYRLDALRQRLFNLRGELFDYAASGAVPFDHPAYGLLRTRINRLIRFAHRFTGIQLLLLVLDSAQAPMPDSDPLHAWQRSLDTVEDEEVRLRLKRLNNAMLTTLVWHMVTGSIVLMASLFFFGIAWGVKQIVTRATVAFGQAIGELSGELFESYVGRFPVEQLEVQAFEAGEDVDTPSLRATA